MAAAHGTRHMAANPTPSPSAPHPAQSTHQRPGLHQPPVGHSHISWLSWGRLCMSHGLHACVRTATREHTQQPAQQSEQSPISHTEACINTPRCSTCLDHASEHTSMHQPPQVVTARSGPWARCPYRPDRGGHHNHHRGTLLQNHNVASAGQRPGCQDGALEPRVVPAVCACTWDTCSGQPTSQPAR